MARKLTFDECAERYAAKFPGKELIQFEATTKPCVIRCSTHGEQQAGPYYAVMQSKHGCPLCGNEAQAAAVRKSPIESNVQPGPSFHFWSSTDPLPEDEYVFLPFYKDTTFAGGAGAFEQDDHNGFKLPFGKSTLKRYSVSKDKAACFTVSGNSMEPAMPDGATIGVNMADKTLKDGKVYAFMQEQMFRVKVLHRMPGNQVRLHSFNNMEHVDEIVAANDLEIVGRVFWWSVLS